MDKWEESKKNIFPFINNKHILECNYSEENFEINETDEEQYSESNGDIEKFSDN